MNVDEVKKSRVMDPGRGAFCDIDKNDNPVNLPPHRVEPLQTAANPRGARHIDKTRQDHMPKDSRPRVKEAQRQAELRRQGK
jgi:hypothetical protein